MHKCGRDVACNVFIRRNYKQLLFNIYSLLTKSRLNGIHLRLLNYLLCVGLPAKAGTHLLSGV